LSDGTTVLVYFSLKRAAMKSSLPVERLAALAAHAHAAGLAAGYIIDVVGHPHGLVATRAHQHDVGCLDRALALGDAALDLLARVGTRVTFDHHHVLHQDLARVAVHREHTALLALVTAGNDLDCVFFLDIYPHRLGRFPFCDCHQITSSASETIFMNFFSRSSLATGPNTRVPTGSPTSLINTAALESKRMYVPSLRRVSLRMRTITQRTTLPFLIAESGAASFTAAVTTSPSPARRPRSPPRGRMQESLRAPLLSATSRIVRIPIINKSPSRTGRGTQLGSVCPDRRGTLWVRLSYLNLDVQILRLRGHLRRPPHDVHQPPPLQLAQRTALDNPNHIAQIRRALFIVRVEFLPLLDDALIQGMRHAPADFHHDGLLHLGRNPLADLFVFQCRPGFDHCRFGFGFGHLLLLPRQLPLPQDGVNPRPILLHLADLLQAFHLSHRHLKMKTEHLLVHFLQLLLYFLLVQIANFLRLHIRYSASSRPTNLVLMGSLWAASRMAASAVARSTPSISKRIFPGRITATHSSGAPLPLPIRVSAGFLVIGLSGNKRIHTLPPRLMERVMATRAASICRDVIHAHSMAFRPNS